ncbi:MAG: ABC transporter permease [Nocardioides sp.]
MSGRVQSVVAPVVVGILGLGLWFLLTDVIGVGEFLMPKPADVADAIGESRSAIWDGIVATGFNAFVGLSVGGLLGVLLAGIASWSWVVDSMIAPLVGAAAVVPIVALAPVLNTMFGVSAQTGRQIIAAIAAFVPVFINTLRGLRQTTPQQRDLMRSYAASSWQVFGTITLPTATPYVFTGLRIASSLAVISALVAEYFGGPRDGLGSSISSAASTNQARAWAYVGGAIALGLLFYLVTLAAERVSQRRYPV